MKKELPEGVKKANLEYQKLKSTLRLPSINAGACSGLTLGGAWRCRTVHLS